MSAAIIEAARKVRDSQAAAESARSHLSIRKQFLCNDEVTNNVEALLVAIEDASAPEPSTW
jgi:hypothetical protein